MIDYIFQIFNEIISYDLFKSYITTNFSILISDGEIVSCYLIFCILLFFIVLVLVLFLIYFIKHTKNLWFGRRRIR